MCTVGEFAVCFHVEDAKFYCDSCMHSVVTQAMQAGVKPLKIKFRKVAGCVHTSNDVKNVRLLKTDNWQAYLLASASDSPSGSPKKKGGGKSAGDSDDDEYEKDNAINCSRCATKLAEVFCGSCAQDFCRQCFDRRRKAAMFANHIGKPIVRDD